MADLLATLVPVLGRALLHFIWQGALIGLLAAAALQLLRNGRPQARYAVACIAMLACVLVPLAGVMLQLADTGPAQAAESFVPASRITMLASLAAVDVAAWPARFDGLLEQGLFPLIVALWAAGASVLSLRMAMGVAWIRRLHATPQGPAHAIWQSRLDTLAQRFGLTQHVALRLVDTLDSPASAGWLRPVVLLPTALIARMPLELIEALLAHELAHIRRHDYLVNLLQGVVEALLFYHPVTWWLSRRIRVEREHIADQLAAGVTGAPRRLALALSELSDFNHHTDSGFNRPCSAPPHLAQAAHGGHLMSRIEQLVHPGRRAAGGKIAFPLLGLAAACIAIYAQAQIATPKPAPAHSTAAVAVPAPAVVQGPVLKPHATVAQVTRIQSHREGDAFALVRKGRDGFTMSGSTDDIPAIEAARDSLGRDFVWFRRADQAYVIDDPATVARAQEAWREVDRLNPQMEALGARMEVHSKKLEGFSAKMQQLSSRHQESPAMEQAAHKMEALAVQQQTLAAQQMRLAAGLVGADQAQRHKLQGQMDTLTEQMDALTERMEQQAEVLEAETEQLEANHQPMEALSQQMEAASEPMEALGEQMGALGEQQAKQVEAAERELQKLISAALEQGLAKPAPGRASKQ